MINFLPLLSNTVCYNSIFQLFHRCNRLLLPCGFHTFLQLPERSVFGFQSIPFGGLVFSNALSRFTDLLLSIVLRFFSTTAYNSTTNFNLY